MKATSSKKPAFHSFDPLIAARSIIALIIIMLAASVCILFRIYRENIVDNNMFYPFIILTFVVMGLLVGLLFLVNPSHSKKK